MWKRHKEVRMVLTDMRAIFAVYFWYLSVVVVMMAKKMAMVLLVLSE